MNIMNTVTKTTEHFIIKVGKKFVKSQRFNWHTGETKMICTTSPESAMPFATLQLAVNFMNSPNCVNRKPKSTVIMKFKETAVVTTTFELEETAETIKDDWLVEYKLLTSNDQILTNLKSDRRVMNELLKVMPKEYGSLALINTSDWTQKYSVRDQLLALKKSMNWRFGSHLKEINYFTFYVKDGIDMLIRFNITEIEFIKDKTHYDLKIADRIHEIIKNIKSRGFTVPDDAFDIVSKLK